MNINIIRGYATNNKGFTLIELLVVIAIIGTLSTIGFLALTSATDGADDAKKLAELNSFRSAVTLELARTQKYPVIRAGATPDAAKIHCANLDTHQSLATMKTDLSGITHANYDYCSNETGTKFLISTTLTGQLPVVTVTRTGSTNANTEAAVASGNANTHTKVVTCATSTATARAASGVYCIGNI